MTFTLFVLLFNFVLALAAFFTNAWASTQVNGWLGRLFFATAVLALIYSGGYLWLVFNPASGAVWSQALRPLGFFSWPLAWLFPPVIVVRHFKMKARRLEERTEKMIEDAVG